MNIEVLRKEAEPGDIVLIGGNNPFQQLIQYGQKVLTEDGSPSLWSHALLVYDKRLFLESTIRMHSIWRIDNGVQYSGFEEYSHAQRAVLIKPPLTNLQRQVIIKKGVELENSGIPYPVSGLFWSLFAYYITGRFGKKRNYFSHNGLYCSAFVQDCYDATRIDFTKEYGERNTAPEHIWQWAVSDKCIRLLGLGGIEI